MRVTHHYLQQFLFNFLTNISITNTFETNGNISFIYQIIFRKRCRVDRMVKQVFSNNSQIVFCYLHKYPFKVLTKRPTLCH